MSSRIGVVSTAPAVDRTHLVPSLVPGGIHRPATVLARPGGKGFNVASVLHALGADVVVAAPLAGASGRWLAEAAAAEGLDVRATWVPGDLRTCLSVFSEDDGRLTEFYEPPPPVAPADWDRFVVDAIAAMTGPDAPRFVAVSGKLPPTAPESGLAAIVAGLVASERVVALDADGRGVREAIAAGPALLKVNGLEAAALTGLAEDGAAGGLQAAAALRAMGAGSVVVTLGRAGAVALDADGAAWQVGPAAGVSGRFPVGSGDAFLAGMLFAWGGGAPFGERLRLGAGAAAANTEQPGAGLVDVARARALAATLVVARSAA
ncbi:MAG: PfkB family carbohydrate kinase [Chloroflexota bacterium]